MNSRITLRKRLPPNLKLTKLEETVTVRYIIDMDTRGSAPRLASVEDMANYLLEVREQNA